jgi:BirA family transcriptional regulator, biotin operon repressor / biotin---[acetyl-CoA-carboxylase] ligase
MNEPQFPPLFRGQAAADPAEAARRAAREGCDPGLVCHDLASDRLRAAVVFAPEQPLSQAMIALPLCGIGFRDALGALAPPEVAVHLGWDGTIHVNGARCGALKVRAATTDPAEVPDWLAIALDLALWPETEETGHMPDRTALFAEGCAEVDPVTLLEAWVRHLLVHLNTWEEEGAAPLHRDWTGVAHGVGKEIEAAGRTGIFLGVDEGFGLLLKTGEGTTLVPLTALLEPR